MTDTTDTASLKKQIDTAADIIRDLTDRLKAERQRADEYRDCIRVLADQLSVNALPKEVIEAVAALKGEQVPVAYVCTSFLDAKEDFTISKMLPVGTPLYDRPQKPVVLLPKFTDRHTCMNSGCDAAAAYKEDVIAINKAAGGIVKDGE